MGKLGPNLEGPYRITDIMLKGSYKLEEMDVKTVNTNWNAAHLKWFYFLIATVLFLYILTCLLNLLLCTKIYRL